MMQITTKTNRPIIAGYKVSLEPISEQHLAQVRSWRNSSYVRTQMVTDSVISKAEHEAWFGKINKDPSQQHWIVNYKDTPIGVTNVRSLTGEPIDNEKSLEPGLYIGEPKFQGNIIAFSPSLALYDYCFNTLGINSLIAKVKYTNDAALNYNKKLGYSVVQQGELVSLALEPRDYEQSTVMLKRLLSR